MIILDRNGAITWERADDQNAPITIRVPAALLHSSADLIDRILDVAINTLKLRSFELRVCGDECVACA